MHPLLAGRLGRRRHVIDATELAKKSLAGWKNYKEMLKPAMEIITQKDKYKNLNYS